MKKIVVLDGYTLNPGDLSWSALEALGELTVHDRTPKDLIVERASEAEYIYTNKTPITREPIEQLPKLKFIGALATGYNVIDVAAAAEKQITVCNVPDYSTRSVAQMVFAFILHFANHVAHHAKSVNEGRWSSSRDFCYWDFPLMELDGASIGIIGMGRIGRETARLAQAFGMTVITPSKSELPEGVRRVEIDELFKTSDFVSLHSPLTEATRHMVGKAQLDLMKPTAYLINTGRGPLIDEQALAEALNSGKIAGAGLDVLHTEPPPVDNPLIGARNCVITPHIAWASRSARLRLLNIAVENLRQFIAGTPQNVIN